MTIRNKERVRLSIHGLRFLPIDVLWRILKTAGKGKIMVEWLFV